MKVQILIAAAVLGFSQLSVANESLNSVQDTAKSNQTKAVTADNLDYSNNLPVDVSEEMVTQKKTHNPHKILNTKFLDRRPYMPAR